MSAVSSNIVNLQEAYQNDTDRTESMENSIGEERQYSQPSSATTALQHTSAPGLQYGIGLPLADPPSSIVDIVFVHGLMGDRVKTWSTCPEPPERACYWPQDLLPSEIDTARIMSWGYDSRVVSPIPLDFVSTNGQHSHAENLLNELVHVRNDCADRPIVFVCHSMGGLVCIRSILRSESATLRADEHLRQISKATRGIIFLGTPHLGSKIADAMTALAGIINLLKKANVGLLESLQQDKEELRQLSQDFEKYLTLRRQNDQDVNITCFFEELEKAGIGRIVERKSATLAQYPIISIHANHRDMVKFATKEDNGFQKVKNEIKRVMKEVKKEEEKKAKATGATNVTHHGNNHDNAIGMYGTVHHGPTNIGHSLGERR